MTRYTVADAKDHLPRLLREAESGVDVEVTRRGQPVAVVVGMERYDDLVTGRASFWERYQQFRESAGPEAPEIDPDEVFDKVRDRSPGRDFAW